MPRMDEIEQSSNIQNVGAGAWKLYGFSPEFQGNAGRARHYRHTLTRARRAFMWAWKNGYETIPTDAPAWVLLAMKNLKADKAERLEALRELDGADPPPRHIPEW
jgi:hypothetical protein